MITTIASRLHTILFNKKHFGELKLPSALHLDLFSLKEAQRQLNAGHILTKDAYFRLKKFQFSQCFPIRQPLEDTFAAPELKLNVPVILLKTGNAIALYTRYCLGKGDFGRVNLGIDIDTGEQYAIKIVPNTKLKYSEISALERTGQLLGHLSGRNLHYLVIPLQWGKDFRKILKNQTKLNIKDILKATIMLGDELNQLHMSGFLHRDIKLANTMWDPTTKTAKLIDLGFAVQFNKKGKALATLDGTPIIWAPELLTLKIFKHFTRQTDIYAFGILIAELMTSFDLASVDKEREKQFKAARRNKKKLPNIVKESLSDITASPSLDTQSIVKFLMCHLIQAMIEDDPNKRPTLNEIIKALKLNHFAIKIGLDHITDDTKMIHSFLEIARLANLTCFSTALKNIETHFKEVKQYDSPQKNLDSLNFLSLPETVISQHAITPMYTRKLDKNPFTLDEPPLQNVITPPSEKQAPSHKIS